MTAWVWGGCSILFILGALCLVLRRQFIAMLVGVELMLNAANAALVYTAVQRGDPEGLAVALMLIAVAAAEVVVGLALILALVRDGTLAEGDSIRGLAG